jgi:predicted transcriptional regulator
MINVTIRTLNSLREKMGFKSDNQLAIYWGVSRQRIAEYRRGATLFSDEKCIEIAELLGIDAAELILEVQAERANNSARYKVGATLSRALDVLRMARKFGIGVAPGALSNYPITKVLDH